MNSTQTTLCVCGTECQCAPCNCGQSTFKKTEVGCNGCDPCTCGVNCACDNKEKAVRANGCACGQSCVCVSCHCDEGLRVEKTKVCCH